MPACVGSVRRKTDSFVFQALSDRCMGLTQNRETSTTTHGFVVMSVKYIYIYIYTYIYIYICIYIYT